MPYHLSLAAIARIEDAIRETHHMPNHQLMQQLAVDHRTTLRTVYRHKARIDAGLPVARRSGGPRRVITWEIEQAIKLLLDEKPWFYQDEIADFLQEVFDIEVCQATISLVLKRIKVTRKKLKVEVA
jgi:transposase